MAPKPSSNSTQFPEIIMATVGGDAVRAASSSRSYQRSIRFFWSWWIWLRYSDFAVMVPQSNSSASTNVSTSLRMRSKVKAFSSNSSSR